MVKLSGLVKRKWISNTDLERQVPLAGWQCLFTFLTDPHIAFFDNLRMLSNKYQLRTTVEQIIKFHRAKRCASSLKI